MKSGKTTTYALVMLAGLSLGTGVVGGCAGSRSGSDGPIDTGDIGAEVREAGAQVREAQRYEVAGDDARAIEHYQLATQAYNEMPVAWNNLGRLLMKRGENLTAANAFKTASELSPTDPRPMYNLGALWEQLGYYEDAEHWYDEALIRDPRHLASLRRAILVDQLRDKVRPITAERLKLALLMEREPWWVDRFKRYQIHLRESLADSGRAGSGGFDFSTRRSAAAPPTTAPSPTLPPTTSAPASPLEAPSRESVPVPLPQTEPVSEPVPPSR